VVVDRIMALARDRPLFHKFGTLVELFGVTAVFVESIPLVSLDKLLELAVNYL
jgi:hypothetical protein